MNTQNVLSIRKAAEELGIADLDTLRRAAKKFGALMKVAGLEYVDPTRFEAGVQAELQTKIERVSLRSESKTTGSSQYGLLKARTDRAPKLIIKKETAIIAARKQMEDAPNPYEKSRAKKHLAALEASLKLQKENFEKDKVKLNQLLNEETEA